MDMFDDDLMQVLGERYDDGQGAAKEEPKQKTAIERKEHKFEKPRNEVPVAEFTPVAKSEPSLRDRLIGSIKWAATFGGLNMLIWYWETAGLMDTSIAVPCMWVCCFLAGFGVGKNALVGRG